MSLEGYTGPTSGRITIGGGAEPVVERFTDPPLTREESAAVAWFTVLSPNEQLREVRRLKWNLAVAQSEQEANLRRARRAEAESASLTAERDARRPDGYEVPRAASELLSRAVSYGWREARRWVLSEDGTDARLEILIGRGSWRFQLAWTVPKDRPGHGALSGRGLVRSPGRDWNYAPPLKEVRRILAEE